MSEKLLLNNAIILMKKSIKKAKVLVTAKIIKKIKETKIQNEKNPENHKLKIRLRKYDDQLDSLKHSNAFDLTISVLLSKTHPKHVLTNGAAKPDEVVLAHIQSVKHIQKMMDEIKEKFNLDDESTGWRTMISEMGKNNRNKKIKSKKKVKKPKTKAKNVKKSSQVETASNKAKQNEWKIETIETKNSTKDIVDVNNVEVKEKKRKKQPETVEIDTNSSNDENVKKSIKSIDSFFVTDNGTAYMAIAAENRTQTNHLPSNGLDRKARRAEQFGRINYGPKSKNQKTFHGTDQQFNSKGSQCADNNLGVHPSWIAKQKEKGIGQFIGKKTTFDDEEKIDSNSEVDQSNLHPSWSAKQKLKPVITEFKGKKIKFSD